MGKYTKEDILRIAQEENVKFVRLQFTDILGQLKNVAITVSQLERRSIMNACLTALRLKALSALRSLICIFARITIPS